MKSFDLEGNWACATIALIVVGIFVQYLGVAPWLTHVAAFNAIVCGSIFAFIYFGEFGLGRVWYGGIIPACAACWGLQVFF